MNTNKNPDAKVSLVPPDGKGALELYPYKAGEHVTVFQGATGTFPHSGKSAGIVYVSRGAHGITATDNDVDDSEIWRWVQEWMQKGMRAETRHAQLVSLLERARFALRDIEAMPELQFDISAALTQE